MAVSCKQDIRPPDVLAPNEFANVLTEIYLAEARLTGKTLLRDSALQLFIPYEQHLFQQLHYSDSVIHKTYQYYFDRPEQLEKIYAAIIDTLNLREQKLRAAPQPKDTATQTRKRILPPK
ncbi:MAG: DUF4296 domain-containing protein [Cyclobacteriaceae bacterium]|nr:DUF4296 domain-containing protein [Cyclobacteriaceae bacterium]